jgi:hypothetical protein
MDIHDAIHDLENEIFKEKMKKSTSLILHKLNIQLGHLRSTLKEIKEPGSPVHNKTGGTVINLYNNMGSINLSRSDSEKVMEKIAMKNEKNPIQKHNNAVISPLLMSSADVSRITPVKSVAPEDVAESMKRTLTKTAVIMSTIPGIYVPTSVIINEISKSPEKKQERIKTGDLRMYSKNPKAFIKMDKVASSIPCVVQSKKKSLYSNRYAGVVAIGKGP